MDHAGDFSAVFAFYRHDKPPVALGHNRFLQAVFISRRAQKFFELIADFRILLTHFSSNVFKIG